MDLATRGSRGRNRPRRANGRADAGPRTGSFLLWRLRQGHDGRRLSWANIRSGRLRPSRSAPVLPRLLPPSPRARPGKRLPISSARRPYFLLNPARFSGINVHSSSASGGAPPSHPRPRPPCPPPAPPTSRAPSSIPAPPPLQAPTSPPRPLPPSRPSLQSLPRRTRSRAPTSPGSSPAFGVQSSSGLSTVRLRLSVSRPAFRA